jgi:hypothetical protein
VSESNEVVTEPKLERRTRRRFSAAEKQRLLAEADASPHAPHGEHHARGRGATACMPPR